jgi:hypothetical protein
LKIGNKERMTISKHQLVGTWQLVSWINKDADSNVSYPYGQDAVGYIMYAEDGYMSVHIMRTDRPKFASGDILGGSKDEQALVAQSYIAYCGKYEIQGNKVIHHIEASLFPNWVGVDQERFFEFMDNRLLLSTPPLNLSGKQQIAYLIWERY